WGKGRLLNPVAWGRGGWGLDRVVPEFPYSLAVAAPAGTGVAAARIRLASARDRADQNVAAGMDADPHAGMLGRLPLEIGVLGLGPGHDPRLEIVEDEIAHAGVDGQHRVAVAIWLAHDGDQQVGSGHARLDQPLALF